MKSPLLNVLSVLACVGCVSLPRQSEPSGATTIVSDPDELFLGESWPNGKTIALTARQASGLKEIVWDSEFENPYGEVSQGVMVSPSPDLSYFSIYGKTFHFIPPSTPHGFRLNSAKQQEFTRFMADEFGVTSR